MQPPPAEPQNETDLDEKREAPRGPGAAGFGVALAAALLTLGMIALAQPSGSRYRDSDEPNYQVGGLQLAEGFAPAHRAAPAGPLTWAGWAWANVHAATRVAGWGESPEARRAAAEVAAAPTAVKPYVALNSILFDAYRDQRPMRRFLLWVGAAVWAAGAAAAAGLGWRHARLFGAIVTGGLWATLPLFVELAAQTRPYAWGWAFAAVAAWLADRSRSRAGDALAAIAFGLAVGSRVEMVMLAPLLVCLMRRRDEPPRRLASRAFALLALAALVTLAVAPWLAMSALSTAKSIVAVYVVRVSVDTPGAASTLVQLAWWQGLGPAALLLAVGLSWAVVHGGPHVGRGRAAVLALIAALSLAAASRQIGYGLHHNGWAIVALVLCTAPAAGALREVWPRRLVPAAAAAAVVGLPLLQTVFAAPGLAPPYREDARAVAWIEANVPPDTPIYTAGLLVNPLPTAGSARRGWAWFNDQGWRRKLAREFGRFEAATGASAEQVARTRAASDDYPPAAADDTAVKERLAFRALLILGSRPDVASPRYDVRTWGYSNSVGKDIADARPLADDGAATAPPPAVLVQNGEPLPEFGTPLASWTDAAGVGTYLYAAQPPAADPIPEVFKDAAGAR